VEDPNKPETESKGASASRFLTSATIVYVVMAATGGLVSVYVHGSFTAITVLSKEVLQEALATGGLGAGILLVLNYFFGDLFPAYREFKRMLVSLLGPLTLGSLIFLALISSIGEEFLFRAAIQPSLGIVGTSVVFGLLHMGPGGGISVWSLWAICAGLLLGWMFERTGVLWGPIFCHFLVNAISMARIRMTYLGETVMAGKAEGD
jgi:membrane protease YdiL (CAAX protease family)